MARPIYVEILIRGSLDEIWRRTQEPKVHERWDLRFTRIDYLPRASEQEPQRFTYETRIGFGLKVAGTGESVGSRESDAARTSALKFGSNDPKSLIREGSGYWQYLESGEDVRFLTLYDYRTRYGPLGAVVDALIFRPLLGWATAWSFDRLRLWIERGIDPARSAQCFFTHAICRIALAFIWVYHGLVPKVLLRHPDEIESIRTLGLFAGREEQVLLLIASIEITFGALLILLWRNRALYLLSAAALIALALGAAVTLPDLYLQPFSPLTLTVAMVALCVIGWFAAADLPSARNCLRRKPGNAS